MKNLILLIISSLIVISCEESKNLFAFDSKSLTNKYYNNQILDVIIELEIFNRHKGSQVYLQVCRELNMKILERLKAKLKSS